MKNSEFDLIARIQRVFEPPPEGITGIGDDCAVIPMDEKTVQLVTTDMLVENIHFLKDKIPPRALGHKALAVNLSDIAAMGGTPLYAFLSLALPENTDQDWLQDVIAGIDALARRTGTVIPGGDTTKSAKDIILSLTVLGKAEKGKVKFRRHAKPGDVIAVTGSLGDSGGGLDSLLNNRPHDILISRHNQPQPHLAEGQFLAQRDAVHAMMDISDGLAGDIRHIMQQSGCGAVIETTALPLSPELGHYAAQYGLDSVKLAVSAGEDYCLLAIIAPDYFHTVAKDFEQRFGRKLYAVGYMNAEENNLQFTCNGEATPLDLRGFDHFR